MAYIQSIQKLSIVYMMAARGGIIPDLLPDVKSFFREKEFLMIRQHEIPFLFTPQIFTSTCAAESLKRTKSLGMIFSPQHSCDSHDLLLNFSKKNCGRKFETNYIIGNDIFATIVM